jgi:polyphosphate kinase
MPRNLDRRVEVVTPVEAPALRQRLQEILDASLGDDCNAWLLAADGSWTKAPTRANRSAPALLNQQALERGRRWHDVDDATDG